MDKILLIDDEEDIAQIIEMVLGDAYEFDSITFLENPVEQVVEKDPQLILIDLSIPRIGGEEAVKLLKNNEKTKNIKTYLFSANPELKNKALQIGADGFMMKPFKINELRKFLAEELKK